MQEDPAALVVYVYVEELVLARLVRALDGARLHPVELDCAFREDDAGDAGPEAGEDDGFDEPGVRAVRVERGRGGRAASRDEVQRDERGEEFLPEGRYVSDR